LQGTVDQTAAVVNAVQLVLRCCIVVNSADVHFRCVG